MVCGKGGKEVVGFMKVLQIVPHVGVESSGPSYSVPRLCRGLVENGVETQLSFLREAPQWIKGEVFKVVNYPQHDKFNLGWSPEMLKGLREVCRTADIIHSNSLWMMPNVYPAWAVKGTKCKLVVAPRGTLAAWSLKKGWLKKKIFGWLLQNRVLRQADMFHATSEKEYEEIRAAGYKQPVAIVPIGMEIPKFESLKVSRFEGQRLRRVVFFGRLHKVKAVDRLLQAWGLLNQSNSRTIEQWELVIAGPDNGIRGELEKYIAEHKIPRVRFVGEINGPAKYEFLSAADLYVLPSHTENFGVTVAEALACGTPVIVSKGTPWQGVEGEKEVVVESGSGTVEEREGRGRDTRSTVEDGSQTISCAARVNEIEVVPGTLGGKIALTTNPTGTTSIYEGERPEVHLAAKPRHFKTTRLQEESVAYHVGDVNSGGSDRVAEILSDGATGPSPLADAEHSTRGPVSGTIGNVEASCCRSRSACGWWVSNDPESLAKTLREAMALSDDERRRMGEVGRDWIRRDFSWEGIGAKMKAAYEWLLDPGRVEKPGFVKI